MIQSLYIHIPFCDSICPYCDFCKVITNSFSHEKYIDSLLKEIDSLNIPENSLKTIYIGGGTPTCLSRAEFSRLLSYLHQHFPATEEFTVEGNPESTDYEKCQIMSINGVNRVSLGVQSANETILKSLYRRHNRNDVINSVENLRKSGITNINLDFIYGLPEMTEKDIDDDLSFAFSLNPSHLSFYSLQIEEGTIFYNQKLESESDEQLAKDYNHIRFSLQKHGYQRYEVSNFSKPGFESKHNLTYWKDQQYYACGVSASGYIGNKRYVNTKSISNYIKGINHQKVDLIDSKSEEFEYLMLNLRLTKGFKISDFNQRFNKNFFEEYFQEIQNITCKYISLRNETLRIKKPYIYIMDTILLKLLK
ncbi:MAG: radical SAM family heme chaperone HemW [Bacilli bacterium]